uniref:Myomegalin n=1 Tax=Coturnix japonica TaxID=93934 RepID=A0A8C2UGY6_COTJA
GTEKNSTAPALAERDLRAEEELRELKAQLEEAGFSSVSHIRKYNSLIQAQARELSHLRQTLREGRGVSRSLAQHLRDALRSFEELLRGTDIDYYLGQGFREQLARGRHLAERLSDKLGTSKCLWGHWVLLSRELQEKEKVIESLEAKLKERCESPGSSHPPSESSRSATSTSFVSDVLEPSSDGEAASECSQCPEEPSRLPGTTSWGHAALLQLVAGAQSPMLTPLFISLLSPGLHFDSLSKPNNVPLPAPAPAHSFLRVPVCAGADLLEEHLVEIRSLRQRLEESICTNDRLREQLERRLASTGKPSGTAQHAAIGTVLPECSPLAYRGAGERSSAPAPLCRFAQ